MLEKGFLTMGVFGGETDLRLVDQTFNSFILFW
jgi:hypothetical protein